MKKTAFILLAGIMTIFACKKTESLTKLDGKVNSISGCKAEKNSAQSNIDSLNHSCVQYNYNTENQILSLKHINAVFNCCPKKINCEFSQKNDTIIITESETDGNCDCMCLYDIETEISELKAGSYIIKVAEPYLGNQVPIIFPVIITQQLSGEYCVERNNYPFPRK
jgi:hypothetical protein